MQNLARLRAYLGRGMRFSACSGAICRPTKRLEEAGTETGDGQPQMRGEFTCFNYSIGGTVIILNAAFTMRV